ncbi:hypothetical protein M0812_29546 [Anaeramoeba flamelloides]|uniref:O-GlcNAc transferase C-terminal domain-containing protein n=1 Tax=Anaeramoeba flamelloides TaxID=1746091 RepID=A0AAV7Y5M0_9EUKA|nr:hypothetical protein M0812_29546 [Anaeramoeba flamelloides]
MLKELLVFLILFHFIVLEPEYFRETTEIVTTIQQKGLEEGFKKLVEYDKLLKEDEGWKGVSALLRVHFFPRDKFPKYNSKSVQGNYLEIPGIELNEINSVDNLLMVKEQPEQGCIFTSLEKSQQFFDLNQYNESNLILKNCIKNCEEEDEQHQCTFQLSENLTRQKRYEEAIGVLDEAIEYDVFHPLLQRKKAKILLKIADYKRAIVQWGKMITLNGTFAEPHLITAELFELMGIPEDSAVEFSVAHKLEPTRRGSLGGLIRTLRGICRFDDSSYFLQELIGYIKNQYSDDSRSNTYSNSHDANTNENDGIRIRPDWIVRLGLDSMLINESPDKKTNLIQNEIQKNFPKLTKSEIAVKEMKLKKYCSEYNKNKLENKNPNQKINTNKKFNVGFLLMESQNSTIQNNQILKYFAKNQNLKIFIFSVDNPQLEKEMSNKKNVQYIKISSPNIEYFKNTSWLLGSTFKEKDQFYWPNLMNSNNDNNNNNNNNHNNHNNNNNNNNRKIIQKKDSISENIHTLIPDWSKILNNMQNYEIDVLIDLDCWGHPHYHFIYSLIKAIDPYILINYSGYGFSGSIGVHDFFITDKHCTPKKFEKNFDEKLLFLKSYHTSDIKKQVRNSTKLIINNYTLKEIMNNNQNQNQNQMNNLNHFATPTICWVNEPSWKVSKLIFHSWLKILESVENSKLIFMLPDNRGEHQIGSVKIYINWELEKIGRKNFSNRIQFISPIYDLNERILFYKKNCHIILDSDVFGIQLTAKEALYADVPVITMSGLLHGQREVTSMILVLNKKLKKYLIANSYSQYIEKSILLLNSPKKYKATTALIKGNKNKSILFNPSKWSDQFINLIYNSLDAQCSV